MESRIEILDRLAEKFGKKGDLKTFNDWLSLCDSESIIILVRQAMAEYYTQGVNSNKVFKVATEDSPEVLEPPMTHDYRSEGGSIPKFPQECYESDCEAYDKAPLISQDRLELNKMRVKVEFLEAALSVSNKLNKSEELTEANKQLKQHKEVVIGIENISEQCHGEGLGWVSNQIDELLSKLNKD